MTNKDIFKILLCTYGYDRNIKIETYRGEGGCIGYDIYAENKDGDSYSDVGCEGLIFSIFQILDYMKKENVSFKSKWWYPSVKDLCNDVTRESIIAIWDKQDAKTDDFIEKTKPLDEWRKKHDPCPSCSINKKDHWDIIHYNCGLNHTHSCPIMLEFNSKYEEFRKEFMETVPEFKWKP